MSLQPHHRNLWISRVRKNTSSRSEGLLPPLSLEKSALRDNRPGTVQSRAGSSLPVEARELQGREAGMGWSVRAAAGVEVKIATSGTESSGPTFCSRVPTSAPYPTVSAYQYGDDWALG